MSVSDKMPTNSKNAIYAITLDTLLALYILKNKTNSVSHTMFVSTGKSNPLVNNFLLLRLNPGAKEGSPVALKQNCYSVLASP